VRSISRVAITALSRFSLFILLVRFGACNRESVQLCSQEFLPELDSLLEPTVGDVCNSLGRPPTAHHVSRKVPCSLQSWESKTGSAPLTVLRTSLLHWQVLSVPPAIRRNRMQPVARTGQCAIRRSCPTVPPNNQDSSSSTGAHRIVIAAEFEARGSLSLNNHHCVTRTDD
jgi:hypothetical protein